MTAANLLGKKKVMVITIVAVIAAGAVFAVLVASSSLVAQANAQQQQQQKTMTTWWGGMAGQGMPEIKGSVSVANKTAGFIGENVKVQFAAASETAQGQASAGTVFAGKLGVVQGYLVYTFFVADTANRTGQLVMVDAGNGEVLYTSQSQPLGSFGPIMPGQWSWHSGHGAEGGIGWWGRSWRGHGGFGGGAWH